jgi:hypothetical protein
MERAEPEQVRPVRLELDPAQPRQPLDRDLALQPVELGLGNAGHQKPSLP